MGKRIFLFLVVLIIIAVYTSYIFKANDDMFVQGRFIKIIKADSNFSKLYLKLKNDSIVAFRTAMRTDDPIIEVLKNGVSMCCCL